jgi:hypothetical protein
MITDVNYYENGSMYNVGTFQNLPGVHAYIHCGALKRIINFIDGFSVLRRPSAAEIPDQF